MRVSLQRNAGSVTTFHTVIGNTNVTAGRLGAADDDLHVALANSSLSSTWRRRARPRPSRPSTSTTSR